MQSRILNGDLDTNFGAIYENFVAQELAAHDFDLYYYNNKKRGELNFVIELGGEVVPIEVKSGKDYTVHSALSNIFEVKDYSFPYAVVFTNDNLKVKGKIVYAPIYMVTFLKGHKVNPTNFKIDPDIIAGINELLADAEGGKDLA